mgnify:FL=1
MKSRRFLSAFLCAVLALTLLTPAALANSWGLKSGMILNAVSKTHDYDEYTALAQLKLPDGEVAVMASRYHAVLLYAYQFKGELRLEVSHTAVKQPEEKDYKKVKLQAESPGFVLKYSDMELHFFPWVGYNRRTYTLQSGKIGKLTLQPGGVNSESTGWLTCSDGENTVDWFVADEGVLTLTQLNLRLFPRTMEELGAIMELKSIVAPQCEIFGLGDGEEVPGDAGASTVPVYSAPSESSVRFAKGKASVNLRATVKFYGLSRDESWMLVEYEVSDRTSRFGYVKRSELPRSMAQTQTMIFSSIDMPVTITKDTYLTDDPNVSQYHQMTLKAGDGVRLLGLQGAFYAYIETTLDGKTVRGFVPAACARYPLPTEEAPEIAARLVGDWESNGGGEVLGIYTAFLTDGRMLTDWLPQAKKETLSAQERSLYGVPSWRTYQVYKSTERERAGFRGEYAYILVLRSLAGYITNFYALDFDTDEAGRESFALYFGEGGGNYARYEGGASQ